MKTKLIPAIIAVVFATTFASTNIMADEKPEYNKGYEDGKYNAEKNYKKKGKKKYGRLTDNEGNVLSKEEAKKLKSDMQKHLEKDPDFNPQKYLKDQGYTFKKESGAEKKDFGDRAHHGKEKLAEK